MTKDSRSTKDEEESPAKTQRRKERGKEEREEGSTKDEPEGKDEGRRTKDEPEGFGSGSSFVLPSSLSSLPLSLRLCVFAGDSFVLRTSSFVLRESWGGDVMPFQVPWWSHWKYFTDPRTVNFQVKTSNAPNVFATAVQVTHVQRAAPRKEEADHLGTARAAFNLWREKLG